MRELLLIRWTFRPHNGRLIIIEQVRQKEDNSRTAIRNSNRRIASCFHLWKKKNHSSSLLSSVDYLEMWKEKICLSSSFDSSYIVTVSAAFRFDLDSCDRIIIDCTRIANVLVTYLFHCDVGPNLAQCTAQLLRFGRVKQTPVSIIVRQTSWTKTSVNGSYLHESAFLPPHDVDHVSWNADHGRQSEQQADKVSPPRVMVVKVSQWSEFRQVEDENTLYEVEQRGQWRNYVTQSGGCNKRDLQCRWEEWWHTSRIWTNV